MLLELAGQGGESPSIFFPIVSLLHSAAPRAGGRAHARALVQHFSTPGCVVMVEADVPLPTPGQEDPAKAAWAVVWPQEHRREEVAVPGGLSGS